MAGLKSCIKSAQMQGVISLEEAGQLYKRYDEIARRVLSPAAVRQQLIAELEATALEKKRATLLMETRRLELEQQVMGHTNAKGVAAPQDALPYLIEHHGQAKSSGQTAERAPAKALGSAFFHDLPPCATASAGTGSVRSTAACWPRWDCFEGPGVRNSLWTTDRTRSTAMASTAMSSEPPSICGKSLRTSPSKR